LMIEGARYDVGRHKKIHRELCCKD
jgi:hypothetical protein